MNSVEEAIGLIDPDTIISLSYEADVEDREPRDIAKTFLQDNGLLE